MTRVGFVWGGAAAAILALGALAFGVVIVTTATPAAHVQRYLEALARDDLVSAAQLAGLEPPIAMPLGDDGEPSILRVINSTPESDGTVAVVAEYGGDDDAARVTFRLEPAPPTLGVVPAWAFAQTPVATLSVAADQHDRFTMNDRRLTAAAAGGPVTVTVFVPARVTARLAEPLLSAEPVTLRVTADTESPRGPAVIVLAVTPSERLERTVLRQVNNLLIECTSQQVLQPTGCPFGIMIDDRVTAPPVWKLDGVPDLTIESSERPGVWRVRGDGSVRLVVPTQKLFDGAAVVRDELVGFVFLGDLVLEPGGPLLTIYPPEG